MSEPSEPAVGEDRLEGRGDDLYAALLAAHEGLSDGESQRLNARLVLLLANELGDVERACRVFAEARRAVGGSGAPQIQT